MRPGSTRPETGTPLSALSLGTRVWSVPDGKAGRIVTRTLGGLTYGVMLEGASLPEPRCGFDLLPLSSERA
jgi:hypothetical protein